MLYYVDKLPNFIDIGEEAENIAVNVEFDYTAWAELHGPGAAQLLVQRPQDTNPYPAVTTTADDVLSWKPTQTDTAFVGRGKIQLIYSTADEVLEKSPIIYIMTGDSLEGAGDPPEPYEDWIDSLTDLAAETLINAQAAANSADAAENAKDDAVNAKTAAEDAQLAAETAQGKAEDAADDAEDSAGEAAGYASDASGYATAAYNAQTAAESAKEAIENMTVTASVDANVGTPSIDVTKTEVGGVVNIDLDFHNLKGADGVSPTDAVTDVQVAGTSVVSDHVANIPYADTSTPGVMKINPDYGVAFASTSKFPYINAAVTGLVQPGSNAYRPIVPKYQHESAFFGLSKAAGVDLANETVTVGTYPATAKSAIKSMLGVPNDAGDIAFDDSETYPADTVGSEISSVKSAIQQKAAEPTGTKSEGKVYGLDSALNPVWVDQSGGGDDVAPVITDTASGAIASFPDGAENKPVKSVVVDIDPVQNLNGYDNPWPGGGGVNQFGDYTVVNGYVTSAGAIASESNNRTFVLPIEANTAYAIKIVRTNATGVSDNDDVQIGEFYSDSRPVAGSTGGARLKAGGYENNIFSTTFTTSANAKWLAIKVGNVTKTNVEATIGTIQLEKGSAVSATYSPYSNICPITGWTGTDVWDEPTHDTSAQPTLSISWQTEAGTVYGGALNVITGEGSDEWGYVELSDLSWSAYHGFIYAPVADMPSSNWVLISDTYESVTYTNVYNNAKIGVSGYSSNHRIALYDPAVYTSGGTINTNLLKGVHVCYKRETPVPFAVDPATLNTLYGQNNIWATTGDVAVSYRADTKLYIDKKLSELAAQIVNS